MALPNKILLSTSVVNIEASANSASRTLHNKDINLKDWINDQFVLGLLTVSAPTVSTPNLGITNTAEGGTGQLVVKSISEVHTLAAANTSDTTTISLPIGVMVLGASFNVDTLLTTSGATDTWEAAFITGSTTALAPAGTLRTVNTKVDVLVVPEITAAGVAEIQFTAPGAETFTAGVIEVVVYYVELTSLGDV